MKMKLPKFVPSIKPRSGSASSSPLSSPPKAAAFPGRLLSSPKSVMFLESLPSSSVPFSERKKAFTEVSVVPTLSKSEQTSEIIEETSDSKRGTCSTPSRMISAGLVRELEIVFQQFDANNDGKISATELGAVLRSL
eukprot:c14963_g1_i1 orf=1-408(-)